MREGEKEKEKKLDRVSDFRETELGTGSIQLHIQKYRREGERWARKQRHREKQCQTWSQKDETS